MKRFISILLLIIVLICCLSVFAYADVVPLRAGGGGGGGGGGSVGGGSFRRFFRHFDFGVPKGAEGLSVILYIIFDIVYIVFLLALIITPIIVTVEIIKKRKKSKKIVKNTLTKLESTEVSWKQENINRQVADIFYKVQNAWTEMNIYKVKNQLGDQLYEKFTKQIETMKKQHTRNVLRDIMLVMAEPISAYDHDDDTRDYVWYHINGSMIDYMVDTDTMQKLEGSSKKPVSFEEYWKFMKKGEQWVLCEIRQIHEFDKVEFQADRKREI